MFMNALKTDAITIAETSGLTYEEWLEFRKSGIGGSDCAAVFHQSPFQTCRDLYYSKIGDEPEIDNDDDNWIAKEYGNCLEDLVGKIFSRKTGLKIFKEEKMFKHPVHEFMLANVDFFVEENDGSTSILECKTSSKYMMDKWTADSVPLNYEMQCRHYMCVLGINKTYIALLTGNNENDFLYRVIERDLDFEEDIIEAERNFWYEHVKKLNPPEYFENPELVFQSIKNHFGANKDSTIQVLDQKYLDNITAFLDLKNQKSEIDKLSRNIESKIKNAKNPILEEIKNGLSATLRTFDRNYFISNKPTKRESINKESLKKLKLHHPDIYNEYVTETESRNFKVEVKEN